MTLMSTRSGVLPLVAAARCVPRKRLVGKHGEDGAIVLHVHLTQCGFVAAILFVMAWPVTETAGGARSYHCRSSCEAAKVSSVCVQLLGPSVQSVEDVIKWRIFALLDFRAYLVYHH